MTLVLGGAGAFLYSWGISQICRNFPPFPEHTAETVREDIEWAKTAGADKNTNRADARPSRRRPVGALEYRVKQETDWRFYYSRNPWAFKVGAAYGLAIARRNRVRQ